eukprot:Cvel_26199.t1-p1 / transcript=Cvel_26199.t1 / gene=Cvel_26199 / organism=Chromera_velia_CCMP2878 / gene_product=hypothetical protein / transcript_product=hypothetical protein / location=Cvel_scaffold3083:978-3317(-) / protein_length=191 / sequence_SO=supercontig / SO=protein_coding / is_pseudo=false
MIARLFLFELLSRLDLSLMVKSALEITEKNFNREEFSVPQVAILYSGDAVGRDFTLSAIEKQTPILVLQILTYCYLRDADLGGDCMFPQLFKLMTIRGLEVMLMRRLSQPWHTRAVSFDKKAILTVATKIAEVTGPPTMPSDFVDIIKNITQLEAAFSEEVIVRMNQNFMETLIRVKGTAKEDSLTVGARR